MTRGAEPEKPVNSDKLAPEIRRAIEGRGDEELARRATWGPMAYSAVWFVVAVSTTYGADHPVALPMAGCLMLFLGSARIFCAIRVLAGSRDNIARNTWVFRFTTYATFVVWGIFCALTVHWYAGQWTDMLLLLCTAALAGGASSSLAPDFPLASRCLVLLIGPSIFAILTLGDLRYLGLAALAALYLVFLLAQTRNTGRAFWEATVATEQAKLLGSAELRQAESQRASLAAAVEQTAEEILITDVEGIVQYCNPSFEQLTGYRREEVIGRNLRFLQTSEQDTQFYADMWVTLVNGAIWTGRFTNRKKDGTIYYSDGTISPIHDVSGKLTGFVSATGDVTGRLRMEEQLRQAQKMESIGRLAGGVAHDFNNLLTVIAGYAGLLEEKLSPDGPLRDHAKQIVKACAHAAGLTRQLLTFSRKQTNKPKPLDLNLFVEGMCTMLQRLVGEDVEVVTELEPSLWLVRADSDQTSQILINLAANARDAMPNGGRLCIRTANLAAEEFAARGEAGMGGPVVLLAVSDTGVGMSYETRQNIFDPFFTTKEKGKGTGLGLSTVYGIVKQNNGAIAVESQPGKGSTFSVYLPRVDEVAAAPEKTKASRAGMRGSETILVVEDHEDVRGLIVGALELSGFQVLQACDGESALQLAGQHTGIINLLLTDVIMPGINGKDLAVKLTSLRPGIKVLFISGYSGELIAHRGVLEVGIDYLAKPFTPAALVAKVREMLGSGEQGTPNGAQPA